MTNTLNIGDIVLETYQVKKIIHHGAMSNVYLVEDTALGTKWVLKEALRASSKTGEIRYQSILREANIIKALSHTGVPRIVTLKEYSDRALILMDYVDGFSLQDYLNKNKVMDVETTLKYMRQLAVLMSYMHGRFLLYRDLKPDNVMVERGVVKLLDFGISEVVKEGNLKVREPLGTRGYAAPEQYVTGADFDFRSDIYAFGATMFHLLTGVHPNTFQSYEVETERGRVRKINKSKPLNVRELNSIVPEALAEFILHCCAEKPEDRYSSFNELIYALDHYDVIDHKNMMKYRKKLRSTVALGVLGVSLVASSLIPLYMEGRDFEGKFQEVLEASRQSKTVEDWAKALDLKPAHQESLVGILEAMKVDGLFSPEEQQQVLNYILPNIDEVRNNPEYGELAYKMGQMFWFYTDTSEERLQSLGWFEDAIRYKSDELEKATIMASIGEFNKNINGAVREAADAGLYGKYWDNLLKVKSSTQSENVGEILELQMNEAISGALNQYTGRLKSDGVPKESLEKELRELERFMLEAKPTGERSQRILDKIKSNLEGVDSKIQNVYYEPTNK